MAVQEGTYDKTPLLLSPCYESLSPLTEVGTTCPLSAGTARFSALCRQKQRFLGRFHAKVPVPNGTRETQHFNWGLVTRSRSEGRLEQGVKAHGILDLAPSCVNGKFVTAIRGAHGYNLQPEKA